METAKQIEEYLRILNLRTYLALELLKDHGTPALKKAYAYGSMAEDELTALARTVLFADFRPLHATGHPLSRFAKGTDMYKARRDLLHVQNCPEKRANDPAISESEAEIPERDAAGMTSPYGRQFYRWLDELRLNPWLSQGVRLLPGDPVKYTTKIHTIKCEVCKAEKQLITHHVSVNWGVHTLTREWVES